MKKIFLLFLILMLLVQASQSAQAQTAQAAEEKICVLYFYSPTCLACQAVKPFIDSIEQKYKDEVMLNRYDVTNIKDYQVYNKFCSLQQLPLEERKIPLVAIRNKFLLGVESIEKNLENEIQEMLKTGDRTCPLAGEMACHMPEANQSQQILPGISKITLPLVTIAALADSINPCAIGVLIFLLSFLLISSAKNIRRTIIIAFVYVATVYAIYFLAGIGILSILSKLAFLKTVTKIFALVIVLFGIINIKDSLKGGKALLAIPSMTRPLIEKWTYKASLPAAVILGIIVASVELPCTGGMYLAILALLANTATKMQAIFYLIYYNLIFVLPLLVITALFVFGFGAEKAQALFEKHNRKTRLVIGIVLCLLGIILFLI